MKPARSLVGIASLPSELANSSAGLEGLVGGGHAAHDLDELHHLRGVEVVQADELPGPAGGGGLVDHRQRGGVRREHRVGLDDPVELAPHLELQRQALGDRLDHEVAVGEVRVVGRARDAPAHRVGVLLRGLALLDRARELLLDLADALRERRLVDLAQHDLVAGLRRHLRDPVPHQPGPEHAHLLDRRHRSLCGRFGWEAVAHSHRRTVRVAGQPASLSRAYRGATARGRSARERQS